MGVGLNEMLYKLQQKCQQVSEKVTEQFSGVQCSNWQSSACEQTNDGFTTPYRKDICCKEKSMLHKSSSRLELSAELQ